MNVEIHIIQNFAPSNLNRDDTGSPKECEFGGLRRARISSQCYKRAIREYFKNNGMLTDKMAVRTLQMPAALVKEMTEAGKNGDEAKTVVSAFLGTQKIKVGKNLETEYLIFVGKKTIAQAAKELMEPAVWTGLSATGGDEDETESEVEGDAKPKKKKKAKVEVPKEVKKRVGEIFDKMFTATPDIALFGRMVANAPKFSTVAACQVAHSISTNRMSMEFDYYTALDELKEEPGAGMIGLMGFNAPCMYRYLNVDIKQLLVNLGDKKLASEALSSFIAAAINAIPKGKDKTMPANNPPALVMAVVRDAGFWSLTNAFEKPARFQNESKGLVEHSIEKLVTEWKETCATMGKPGNLSVHVAGIKVGAISEETLGNLGMTSHATIDDLVKGTVSAVTDLR